MPFLRIYFAFAAGYLLSYLYPHGQRGHLAGADARARRSTRRRSGLLTSAYFLAFAAMQIPVGILLDRYGPRRVEPVLLAVAACGAALFAASPTRSPGSPLRAR